MGFRVLTKGQIVERWDTLLTGADGQGAGLLADVKRLLDQSAVPDVTVEDRKIAAGIIQGLLGGNRLFLIVRHTTNPNLKPYKMYINTRDYGINLQVCWYLVKQSGLGERFVDGLLRIPVLSLLVFPFYAAARISATREAGILDLNLFDEQDLRAYVTNAHRCLLDAVNQLTQEHPVDPSPLAHHSQGFLGIV